MKKIEAKAKEYRESRIAPTKDYINPCVDIVMSIVENAFIAGVEFALRWISVKEELPEDVMELMKSGSYTFTVSHVLVKTSKGDYIIAKRKQFRDRGWSWSGHGTFIDSVTHWRPIELK
jgi:hypothetical protein